MRVLSYEVSAVDVLSSVCCGTAWLCVLAGA